MASSNLTTGVLADNAVFTRIGLEIHITLASTKKVFNFNNNLPTSGRSINSVEAWELGYLGTLPVLNDEVLNLALRTCLFLDAKISKQVTFDRKVYNYSDLSKGFQITQQENPLGRNGYFTFIFSGGPVTVPISRIQLEEDTAKTSHQGTETMLDFSRSGNPLLELVTEPVFSDIDAVASFVKQLQGALSYIGVSEAKMAQGELRIDLNFSFVFDSHYKTPRYEVKNLNSIRNLRMSFTHELEKHLLLYRNRRRKSCFLRSQTLGFSEVTGQTFVQRKKTGYFYLPETNIPVILIGDNEIAALAKELPVSLVFMWSKLNEKNDSYYSAIPFEKPLLARAVNSFEREKIDYPRDFTSFVSFFFNYFLINVQNYSNSEVVCFLDKKINHLWSLFIFFARRLVAKERVSMLVTALLTKYKDYSVFQWEELLRGEAAGKEKPVLNIEKEVATILAGKKVSRKLMDQPTRIANFLLGILKSKFPSSSFDYRRILEIAANFVTESTK